MDRMDPVMVRSSYKTKFSVSCISIFVFVRKITTTTTTEQNKNLRKGMLFCVYVCVCVLVRLLRSSHLNSSVSNELKFLLLPPRRTVCIPRTHLSQYIHTITQYIYTITQYIYTTTITITITIQHVYYVTVPPHIATAAIKVSSIIVDDHPISLAFYFHFHYMYTYSFSCCVSTNALLFLPHNTYQHAYSIHNANHSLHWQVKEMGFQRWTDPQSRMKHGLISRPTDVVLKRVSYLTVFVHSIHGKIDRCACVMLLCLIVSNRVGFFILLFSCFDSIFFYSNIHTLFDPPSF